MNAKLAWGIVAAALLPLAVGCVQGPGVVRGQNPAEFAPPPGAPVEWVENGHGGHPGGSCPTCEAGQGAFPVVGGGGQPRPNLPFSHVLNHGLNQAGAGHGGHPTHYHSFSYEQPQNLVYPPQNQPAAVIQYPYYTVKGPSDFFMQ